MFMGRSYASVNSKTTVLPPESQITYIWIAHAIFLEIYFAQTAQEFYDGDIPDEWDFDTRFHALFNGDLFAGNVDFTEDIITSIKIKKKTSKDSSWQTIYEKTVNSNEDLNVELFDYLEPVGTITYAYVPIISNSESDYITNTVTSSFDSYFIVEKDISYPIIVNASTSETLNYGASYVKPLGRKYPVTIINGVTGYMTGDIECSFIYVETADTDDALTINEYRQNVYDFLTDGSSKILKSFDGDLYMINVTGDIADSSRTAVYNSTGAFNYVKSKFSWVESGDAYDDAELAYNGFTDVESF